MTKLEALREVLLVKQLHLSSLEVELDAAVVVNIVTKSDTPNRNLQAHIMNYRELISKVPYIWVKHVFRDANCCADTLARHRCYQ